MRYGSTNLSTNKVPGLFIALQFVLPLIDYHLAHLDNNNGIQAENLNIERRYSCRAMLHFEPVAPPATGGISQINKSSLVVHM